MPLPVLEDIRIASPCDVPWESMQGDGRVRFCGQCRLNVYDLSGMTRAEGEALIAKGLAAGKLPCVQLWRRADGTILTQDCPRGLAKVKRRIARVSAVVATLLLALVGVSFAGTRTRGTPVVDEGSGSRVRTWLANTWAPQLAPPAPVKGNMAIRGKMAIARPMPSTTPAPRNGG